jgi:hypothetical protein
VLVSCAVYNVLFHVAQTWCDVSRQMYTFGPHLPGVCRKEPDGRIRYLMRWSSANPPLGGTRGPIKCACRICRPPCLRLSSHKPRDKPLATKAYHQQEGDILRKSHFLSSQDLVQSIGLGPAVHDTASMAVGRCVFQMRCQQPLAPMEKCRWGKRQNRGLLKGPGYRNRES